MQTLMLTDDQLKLVVNNVACTPDGLKLLGHILAMAQIFDTGLIGNARDIYLKGRRDIGIEIRNLMLEYASEKYIELLRKEVKNEYDTRRKE